VSRARAEVDEARAFGFGPFDLELLGPDGARRLCGATSVLGATYSPHCAAITRPACVRGLAHAVQRRGVSIFEGTPALAIQPGRVLNRQGTVRAEVVVRAIEGYTPRLAGHARTLAPIYSLMLATEHCRPEFWSSTGLARRETFSDHRHLIIYGQRTADDRFAFGGRGAPVPLRLSHPPRLRQEPRIHAELAPRPTRTGYRPSGNARRSRIRGGGPLGVSRDWTASVGWTAATASPGQAATSATVSARPTSPAGTLADLIRGVTSDLTTLPWVNHHSPKWTPEPLRWLGRQRWPPCLMSSADTVEVRTGRPSRRAALIRPAS